MHVNKICRLVVYKSINQYSFLYFYGTGRFKFIELIIYIKQQTTSLVNWSLIICLVSHFDFVSWKVIIITITTSRMLSMVVCWIVFADHFHLQTSSELFLLGKNYLWNLRQGKILQLYFCFKDNLCVAIWVL